MDSQIPLCEKAASSMKNIPYFYLLIKSRLKWKTVPSFVKPWTASRSYEMLLSYITVPESESVGVVGTECKRALLRKIILLQNFRVYIYLRISKTIPFCGEETVKIPWSIWTGTRMLISFGMLEEAFSTPSSKKRLGTAFLFKCGYCHGT